MSEKSNATPRVIQMGSFAINAKSELFSVKSAIPGVIMAAGSLMATNLGIAETRVDIGDGATVPAGTFCAKQIEGMLLVLVDLPSTDRQLLSDWLVRCK